MHMRSMHAPCAYSRQTNVPSLRGISSNSSATRTAFLQPQRQRYTQFNASQHPRNIRAQAAEVEEIDPVTGEVITGTVAATIPTDTITTPSGLTWAIRSAAPDDGPETKSQEVLLLHGLGSSSYSYRNTLGLLAGSGFKAWAVDWVGHGASSKVFVGGGSGMHV